MRSALLQTQRFFHGHLISVQLNSKFGDHYFIHKICLYRYITYMYNKNTLFLSYHFSV